MSFLGFGWSTPTGPAAFLQSADIAVAQNSARDVILRNRMRRMGGGMNGMGEMQPPGHGLAITGAALGAAIGAYKSKTGHIEESTVKGAALGFLIGYGVKLALVGTVVGGSIYEHGFNNTVASVNRTGRI